ncbi:MAG: heavy-metal-associated domain-containing protein [Candidatus Tectomicrobia bacterium]|nr:heavy-metal-associated domain-containing protein [Candidatus Tectomicrobia bacterium]
MRTALERLQGVTKARVSFPQKRAEVTYEKGKVTIEQMILAVERNGFKASLIE